MNNTHLKRILIRVDGGDIIGYGHLMRSKALAAEFILNGFKLSFYSRIIDGSAKKLLSNSPDYDFISIPESLEESEEIKWVIDNFFERYSTQPDFIITDAYHLPESQWNQLSQYAPLMVTDVFGGRDYSNTDIVYNAYADAKELEYSSIKNETSLLLGPEYALIRPEIIKARNRNRRLNDKIKTVLVNGGGVDEHDVTGTIADAFHMIHSNTLPDKAYFITGKNYPYSQELDEKITTLPFAERLIEPSNWLELLNNADLAFIAGGSTQYEAAFLGTPYLPFIVEENQDGFTKAMVDMGITRCPGWLKVLSPVEIAVTISKTMQDPYRLKNQSKKGQELIDGKGCQRVVKACIEKMSHINHPV